MHSIGHRSNKVYMHAWAINKYFDGLAIIQNIPLVNHILMTLTTYFKLY